MGRVLVMFSAIMLSSGVMVDSAHADGGLSYDKYGQVLAAYVNDEGEVDYQALQEDRERLDSFVAQLALLPESQYLSWSENEQVAFWINAYNALTLTSVIDHYPIKASGLRALRYPESSIRQIPGVWTRIAFQVMDRKVTLDQIEHEILRKEFSTPGIHMALVCAAVSCPFLRREPYDGQVLAEQLIEQATRFLDQSRNFFIDRENGEVFLSSIFRWFGEDFEESYLPAAGFTGHTTSEKAVLNFISQNLEDRNSSWLRDGSYRVKYLDYDWNLNDQKK